MNKKQISELANEIAEDVIDKYLDVTDFEVEMDVTEFTDETLNLFIAEVSKEIGELIRQQIEIAREADLD